MSSIDSSESYEVQEKIKHKWNINSIFDNEELARFQAERLIENPHIPHDIRQNSKQEYLHEIRILMTTTNPKTFKTTSKIIYHEKKIREPELGAEEALQELSTPYIAPSEPTFLFLERSFFIRTIVSLLFFTILYIVFNFLYHGLR